MGRRKHRPASVFFPFSEYHIKNQISIFVHIFAHFIKNVFHNASRILYNKEKLLFPYKKHLVEIVKNVNLISILYISMDASGGRLITSATNTKVNTCLWAQYVTNR
jgi:hypothetical protein